MWWMRAFLLAIRKFRPCWCANILSRFGLNAIIVLQVTLSKDKSNQYLPVYLVARVLTIAFCKFSVQSISKQTQSKQKQ
jgi:hypothetical protein